MLFHALANVGAFEWNDKKNILCTVCNNITVEIGCILLEADAKFKPTFAVATSFHPTLVLSLDQPMLPQVHNELLELIQVTSKQGTKLDASAIPKEQQQMDSESSSDLSGLFPHLAKKICKLSKSGLLQIHQWKK